MARLAVPVRDVSRSRWGRILTGLFILAAVTFAVLVVHRQWGQLSGLRGGEGPAFRLVPGWLALALALATVNLGWMGAVWVHLYRSVGGELSYRRGIAVWITTNMGRYIPGKVWQLSGLALHLRRTGGSGALALSASLVYQVVILLTGAVVAASILGGRLASLSVGNPLLWVGGLAALALLLHPAFLRRATRVAARLTREEAEDAGTGVPGGRDLAVAGAALLVSWGIYGLGFWCLTRGLWSRSPVSPASATGTFAAAYVVGYAVLLAPGGLVVREGAMTALLAALSPLGTGAAAATAVAARVWTVASELVGLLASAGAARAGGSPGPRTGTPAPGDGRGEGPSADGEDGGT